MDMDDLEMEVEVGAVGRLVWSCVNVRLCFLWRLSRMCLEGKMSNVGGRPYGMVLWADSLIEFLFFYSSFSGRVTGSKKEVVVVEVVVGVVEKVV